MRIKLDENMPAGLSNFLARLGHAVETVPDEGLAGHDDVAIWAAAQRERRFGGCLTNVSGAAVLERKFEVNNQSLTFFSY